MYSMPSNVEKGFIMGYLPKNQNGKKNNLLFAYLDSTKRYTRVSFQMADIGTKHMDSLMAKIHPKIDSIFNPAKYKVIVTGNSVVYARGTNFLIDNLFESVLIAILMISLLMALLFSSFRMILVSMIPNIIPLLITAAAGPAEEERASFNVELTEAGPNKIAVIKIVKEVLALGLAEAKGAVDSAPKVLKEGVKKEEAEKMKKDLEAAGAKVTLK